MLSLCRLPTLCGLIILVLSLVYLSIFGPSVTRSNLDSVSLWHNLAHSLHHPHDKNNTISHHHVSISPTTKTSTSLVPTHLHHNAATATPSKPPGHHSSLSMDAMDSGCQQTKPNLILSAIDGPRLEDRIFIFIQSLDIALGQEILAAQRTKSCPPAPVHVNILVPPSFMEEIPPAFRALMQRYPGLELVPALPDIGGVNVVLRRFKGWSEYLKPLSGQYDRVLAIDLDVVFQRNPFAMPMESDVELLYFAEWRGLKIGQCSVHIRWFDGCANSGSGTYVSLNVSSAYMHRDRICAGSTYGSARAMEVYLEIMAQQLEASNWACNDQAMHIHIYYSGLLDEALKKKGIGRVYLVPNEDALLGTVGTTPMVRYNEWGEMLNEKGQVQHAIHQFKTHARLSDIVWEKYGWMAPVGIQDAIPPNPELVEELKEDAGKAGEEKHAYHHAAKPPAQDESVKELKRYLLANVSAETCKEQYTLCSCRHHDCQLHYEWF